MRIATTVLALVLALSACGASPTRTEGGRHWRAAAQAPLAPRWSPVVAWTGDEVIVVGGGSDEPCPPNASCVAPDPMARDGAAYDPATDTWRPIADAPVPVGYWFRPAVVGRTLVLYDGRRAWFAYDLDADSWSRLPPAPERIVDSGAIPARRGRIFVPARSGRVWMLDVDRRRWSALPADEQRPALEPYAVLPTADGVFACGADPATAEDGDTPRFTVVHRWDEGVWTALPATGSVGNLCEHWTGRRLVSADLQTATGLDGEPPFGGRLDPATGQWTPLPGAPDVDELPAGGWSPVAAAGPLLAAWGYVYDDDAETWTPLGRPDSAVDSGQGAAWADGELVVVGGLDDHERLSAETWVWTP